MPFTNLPYDIAPLHEAGDYPCPAGGKALFVPVKGGAKIRVAMWHAGPREEAPFRPLLLLLSGRGEFIEKYYEPIGALLQRGFDVLTLDWRGQGLSSRMLDDRLRGYVDHFDTYLDDLDRVLLSIAPFDKRVTEPKILMGHSMGGNLSLQYAIRNPQRVQAIALCAPMVGMRLPTSPLIFEAALRFNLLLGRGEAYPTGGPSDPTPHTFEQQKVTRDKGRFASDRDFFRVEPDLLVKGATIGWLAAASEAVRAVKWRSSIAKLTMPILLQSAVADKLVPTQSHEAYVKRLKNGTFIGIDDAEHELMREIDEVVVAYWQNFDTWREDCGL